MDTNVIGKIHSNISISETRVRYCLYARKSTESDEQQALSIDSQIKEMEAIAERLKLHVVAVKRESHSAKESGQRPVFKELLEEVAKGVYNGILTWAPDRLSRNAGDLGKLVDRMDQKKLIQIKTFGQTFTNSPSDKFLLMILCSQAKLENDNKAVNVKRGLRTRCEMGLWPCSPPTGYLSSKNVDQKCQVQIDPKRAPMIKKMFEKVAYEKMSGRRLHLWLKNEIDFKTKNGKHINLGNLYLILRNHFYYGRFEYPKGSGKWYNGKHEPIITKELFDLVQESISDHVINYQNKEFAFTKIMICGLCGSGITADEKFKKQQNGNIHRYVYYGCCKHLDKECKSGYIREEELIEQLEILVDDIHLDEIGMKEKIKSEIERNRRFNIGILGIKEKAIKVSDVDIRNYAKYVLRDGTLVEKREMLECLRSKILLDNKKIKISI